MHPEAIDLSAAAAVPVGNAPAAALDGSRFWPAVVVGAGPAGLATSHELRRRGIEHVVLERGDQPGYVWANLYDSLTLHTGRHLSGLPGMPIPRSVALFAPRADFVSYLHDYVRAFDLPVHTGVEVLHVDRSDDGWHLTTSHGQLHAAALVIATGIVSNPNPPDFSGRELYRGRMLPTAAYRRPADAPGDRVLVVGVGNSGGEIASELAAADRQVDIAVRSGANVVPLTLAGIPIQYLAYWLRKLPRPVQVAIIAAVGRLVELRRGPSPLPRAAQNPLDAIPIIGFHLVDAIKAGKVRVRPGIARFTEEGVVFTDDSASAYDTVVLATGYRAALGSLGGTVHLDAKGFARRRDRVASADHPALYFVGHNYDASGGLHNIARDAPLAAGAIARALKG